MAFDVLQPDAPAADAPGYDVLQPETTGGSGYDVLQREQFTGTPEIRQTTPPRSSEELGAQNAQAALDFNKRTAPQGPQLIQGPTGFERIMGDVGRSAPVQGLANALSVPARILNWAGKGSQAALGDVAAAASGNSDQAGGNLAELAKGGGKTSLPIERALKLADQGDQTDNRFPWATVAARTALGVADTLPKILALEVAPGSSAAGGTAAEYLARSASAADLFGFDDAGNFQPKDAVVGALFPYVMRGATASADVALQQAVKNGITAAGNPIMQKAVHVAATQAAMSALMAAANAPDLIELARTNPAEFRKRLGAMIGQTIAFSVPDLLQNHSRLTYTGPDLTPAPIDVDAEVTPESPQQPVIGPEPPAGVQTPAVVPEPPEQAAGAPEEALESAPPSPIPGAAPAVANFPGRSFLESVKAAEDPEDKKAALTSGLAAVESQLAARVEPAPVPESGTAAPELPAAVEAQQPTPEDKPLPAPSSPPQERAQDLADDLADLEAQLSDQVERQQAGPEIEPGESDDWESNLASLLSQQPADAQSSEPSLAPVQIQKPLSVSTPAAGPAAPGVAGASIPPLTPTEMRAKLAQSPAAETGTGQNGGTAPDAVAAAAKPVATQMPAELETQPKTGDASNSTPTQMLSTVGRAVGRPRNFKIQPRSDGQPDLLDDIASLGGIRTPGPHAGGEYDGYREAMQGPARMLATTRSSASRIDVLMQALNDMGYNFETPDQVWDGILRASQRRQALRKTEAKNRVKTKQLEQFQKRALQGERPKSQADNVVRIKANYLLPGDTFKVQSHTFTVDELHFEEDGQLIHVEVKDGPKFGVQEVDGDQFIYIDKNSYLAGPEHGEAPEPQSIHEGGELFGAPESVEAQKARLAQEAAANKLKAAKLAAAQKQNARLFGSDLDTTADMFAKDRTSRVDKTGQGSLFEQQKTQIGAHPVDPQTVAATAKLYAVPAAKLTATFQLEFPDYIAPELKLENSPAKAPTQAPQAPPTPPAAPFVPKVFVPETPPAGSAKAAARALTNLSPEAMKEAFGYSTVVSSIDPKAAPHAVPQYQVNGTVIRNAADFAKTLIALRSPYSESLKVVILNDDGVVVHSQVLYAGTLNSAVVDPRDFARLANQFKDQGRRMMISHNHPSGNPEPSQPDVVFTRNLNRYALFAGFEVVDHVITNGKRYYSFRSGQVMELNSPELAPWEHLHRDELLTIDSKKQHELLINSLRQSDNQACHLIYLGTRNAVTAVERVAPGSFQTLAQHVLAGIAREGAFRLVIDYGPNADKYESFERTRRLRALMNGSQTDIADFACKGVISAREANSFYPGWESGSSSRSGGGVAEEPPEGYAGEPKPAETEAEPVEEETPEPKDYPALIARRAEILKRLTEIPSYKNTAAERSERFQLSREALQIQRQLSHNEDYVSQLLIQADQVGTNLQNARKAGYGAKARELADTFEGLMNDISQVPQELFQRVYNDLVARKLIMASETGPLRNNGRTLGDVASWLEAQTKDSPRLPILQRLNLFKKLVTQLDQGKDAAARAANGIAAAWQCLKQSYLNRPVDTPFRSIMKSWFAEKQWTGLEVDRFVRLTREQVPNPVRRAGMAVWLDAGGDRALLESQAQEILPQYRDAWKAALNLTPGEVLICRRIQTEFAQKLADAQATGLVDKGREDYGVPQLWDVPPKIEGEYDPSLGKVKPQKARSPLNKLDPRSPFFSLQRTVPSYFDGIMGGGKPKSLDVAGLVGFYHQQFQDSLSDRGVIKALKDAKAADGQPVVMISGAVQIQPLEAGARTYFVDSTWRPKDAVTKDGRLYQSVDHWALKDWQFSSKDAAGNKILVRGDFLVHPDHVEFLKNELHKSALRDPEGPLGKFAHASNWILQGGMSMKSAKFALGMFHMATLAEHSMFHAFAGTPSKARAALLWPSVKGVELDPNKDPVLFKALRHGLELGFGQPRELFEEGLASHGGIWSRVPGVGDFMAATSDFLFRRYLPAIKVKTFKAILPSNLARYRGKLSEDQIYELTAAQMNAAFGGQNWRLLGTNKTVLDVCRLFATAPDFLWSRAKVVGQAAKPYGREQALFLAMQGALVYLAARALCYLFDGDPHTEPENAFRVVFHKRSYGARFIVSDFAEMVAHLTEFASGRLGPYPRMFIEAVTTRDMRTGARIPVPGEPNSKALRSAEIVAKGVAEWFIPMGTEGFLPGAAGREQTGAGQIALSLVGVGSRKYTAQGKMWNLAADFNRAGDQQAQKFQASRDAEARGDSVYTRLTNLLEAGDQANAAKEYDALVKTGTTPAQMEAHYDAVNRSFTGNAVREQQFKASLTPTQLEEYKTAIEERQELRDRFRDLRAASAVGLAQ